MSSRDSILRAIRSKTTPAAELPSLAQAWTTYDDRIGQFAKMLEFVGGRCMVIDDLADVGRELAAMATYAESKQIVSRVAGLAGGNVDLDQIDDPHVLETIDFAILPGEFAVAENGAVWVTDRGLRHRVTYFITQHLALVLPADQLVDNMHQAYQRLTFEQPGYGLFLSGPSKTADIEQSLVIGAHGPRSLTVFFVRSGRA